MNEMQARVLARALVAEFSDGKSNIEAAKIYSEAVEVLISRPSAARPAPLPAASAQRHK
jgi:hypothetical protein